MSYLGYIQDPTPQADGSFHIEGMNVSWVDMVTHGWPPLSKAGVTNETVVATLLDLASGAGGRPGGWPETGIKPLGIAHDVGFASWVIYVEHPSFYKMGSPFDEVPRYPVDWSHHDPKPGGAWQEKKA